MDEKKKYILEVEEDPTTIRLVKLKNGEGGLPCMQFMAVSPYKYDEAYQKGVHDTATEIEKIKDEAYKRGRKDATDEVDTEKIRKRGYDKGLDDIGNALRLLLFQYSNYTLQKIFGYDTARAVVEHFEGSEIVARIRCYEGGVKQDVETIRKEAYDKGYEDATEKIGSDEQAIADKAYKQGLSDAWECVDRIFDMPCKRREQIFSECDSVGVWDILREYSASEAIEKLKEDVHLGDEVTFLPNNAKGIVTECHVPDVYSDNDKYAVWCGGTMEYVLKQHLTKTGRTFPEIVEVLRKMREE